MVMSDYYCDPCDRLFSTQSALDHHKRDSPNHHFCYPCGQEFNTWKGLKEHYVQSGAHAYCQYCDEHFEDGDELVRHKGVKHAWCRWCDKVLKNAYGLQQHYEKAEAHRGRYCAKCKRPFNRENDLRNHLRSSYRHRNDSSEDSD
ncbi:hypothetical protein H0H92_008268 [Tricholoma furcatifolium]|nr:hypothetical protein H0H92_008268 [Tricholoma furcatifolium]